MKKKLISVMLCAAMATTMFSSVAVHAEGDDEGEIYMFISQPEYADAITALIDEYKNVEPGVTINYETTQNDYPTLLKAKLNSGECPDIFSSTSGKEIETYKEYSLDLTGQPLVDAMDDNVAAAMKDANGEGCYGMAIKGNYFGLIYNQDLLDKAGVEKVPETMTELKDCVEKLKAADITPFTSGYAEWWVFKHVFQHFADAASDDVQKMVAGFEDGSENGESRHLPDSYQENWKNKERQVYIHHLQQRFPEKLRKSKLCISRSGRNHRKPSCPFMSGSSITEITPSIPAYDPYR